MNPLVVIVGRQSDEAKGVRGKPFAAGQAYFRAVERAGGIPLMLPPIPGLVDDIPELLSRTDAVVFHGGGDIDPRRYGQEATEESLYGIVAEHDAMELAMVTAAIAADKPVLAICRGQPRTARRRITRHGRRSCAMSRMKVGRPSPWIADLQRLKLRIGDGRTAPPGQGREHHRRR